MSKKEIEIWTIYKHPRDYPEKYVARKFINDKPTNELISSITYDELIHILLSLYPYLTCLERQPGDDPVIMETWL